jgi:hypothetical protein
MPAEDADREAIRRILAAGGLVTGA